MPDIEGGPETPAQANQLKTIEDVEAVLASSGRRAVMVFKHSTACPVSAQARREWRAFLQSPEAEAVAHAWVRVIEERPASLALAERVGVPHQSPQALLIRSGRAVWNDSHRRITAAALRDAVHASATPA